MSCNATRRPYSRYWHLETGEGLSSSRERLSRAIYGRRLERVRGGPGSFVAAFLWNSEELGRRC